MTTEKRIELAAMFLARCINEPLDIRASSDTRKKLCMYALAWADALAEVAEGDKPKTRYDWSKAPGWAQYACADINGSVYWYSHKPDRCIYYGVWSCAMGDYKNAQIESINTCLNWASSVEARPNA